MINIGSFLGNIFNKGRTTEQYEFERWSAGSWEPKGISRLNERNLETLEIDVKLRLQEKKEEFDRLAESMHIEIDEVAIHREIQEILEMDAESLAVLEKKIQCKLQEKKREFNKLLYE